MTPEELVMAFLEEARDNERLYSVRYLAEIAGLNVNQTRKLLKGLREEGKVAIMSAWNDDDGRISGSGYCIY